MSKYGVLELTDSPASVFNAFDVNFLAHATLTAFDRNLMVGGVLADFVRGFDQTRLPDSVKDGISLHHQLDRFTDQHPLSRVCASWFKPRFGRYAAVLVDMAYDHALARGFERLAGMDLAAFSQRVYRGLGELEEAPPRLLRVLPLMQREDWLSSYRNLDGIRLALSRMERRLSRALPLREAGDLMAAHERELTELFDQFFVAAKQRVRDWVDAA